MRIISYLTVVGLGGGFAACADQNAGPAGPKMSISVAPLTLPGIGYACYDLLVENEDGDPVWSQGDPLVAEKGFPSICSDQFGNTTGGDITYVGTCDATDSDGDDQAINTVTLWVDGLYDAGGTDIGEYQNPCGTAGCQLQVECKENADTLVPFSFTIMRDANQGFFDIAVNFADVFCSAKFDTCYYNNSDTGTPIELLFGDDVGDGAGRDWTGVMAFACTGGPDTANLDIDSVIHLSKVVVDCGNVKFQLPVSGLEAGNHNASVDFNSDGTNETVQYALYYGAEQLQCDGEDCNKDYLNIAIDLEDLPAGCTFRAMATAEGSDNVVLKGGEIANLGTTYPYIAWNNIPLDQCGHYAMDNSDYVSTFYGSSVDMVGGIKPAIMCTDYNGTGTPTATTGVIVKGDYATLAAAQIKVIQELGRFSKYGAAIANPCGGVSTARDVVYYQKSIINTFQAESVSIATIDRGLLTSAQAEAVTVEIGVESKALAKSAVVYKDSLGKIAAGNKLETRIMNDYLKDGGYAYIGLIAKADALNTLDPAGTDIQVSIIAQ